ncbi:MAG: MazG nucleotide pyrophosphohydrolase domain-containing protein [Streptosporangiaceae bacterium]
MTSSSGSPVGGASPAERSPGCGDDGAARAAWQKVETALPGLRSLQRAALDIYGRLEPDRALVWTLEELGELAQAIRRGEDRARLEEELGQLTAWMLCLANILDVDITTAVGAAIREEIDRQLAKYGKLKPYQAGG